MLFENGLSNIFFLICLLRKGQQKQNEQTGLHKTKNLVVMEAINKMKRQLLNGKTYLQSTNLVKG